MSNIDERILVRDKDTGQFSVQNASPDEILNHMTAKIDTDFNIRSYQKYSTNGDPTNKTDHIPITAATALIQAKKIKYTPPQPATPLEKFLVPPRHGRKSMMKSVDMNAILGDLLTSRFVEKNLMEQFMLYLQHPDDIYVNEAGYLGWTSGSRIPIKNETGLTMLRLIASSFEVCYATDLVNSKVVHELESMYLYYRYGFHRAQLTIQPSTSQYHNHRISAAEFRTWLTTHDLFALFAQNNPQTVTAILDMAFYLYVEKYGVSFIPPAAAFSMDQQYQKYCIAPAPKSSEVYNGDTYHAKTTMLLEQLQHISIIVFLAGAFQIVNL